MSAPAGGSTERREQSIADLLKELSQETSTLVRQELELARAEMEAKGRQAGKGAGMLGGAGVAGLLLLGALTATVIGALDLVMPFWAAALIATGIWAAIAGALALYGRRELQSATPVAPEQAQDSMKEDLAWAKTRARSGRT